MNRHTATLPDGTVVTRNSKTRTYTYVVVAKRINPPAHATPADIEKYYTGFKVMGWSGRRDLAEKVAAATRGRSSHYVDVHIVPAEMA